MEIVPGTPEEAAWTGFGIYLFIRVKKIFL